MTPDLQKYRPLVEEFDLTDAEKDELIHTVWQIMESFVDRAFGVDPTQQAVRAAGMTDSRRDAKRVDSAQEQFGSAASGRKEGKHGER